MEAGKSASPPGAEGGEEEEDFGYRLFPDRKKEPQSFLVRSLFTFHNRCQLMLRMTLETSPYAQLLIAAMKQSGWYVNFFILLHIVLCQNNIRHQSHMNRVVAHELIHAFDHCRAHVDWFKNVKHLACSEVS
ncbi:UNVERIFIED_CONTAM: hypothetical protein H355_010712 [Colinus virginianus]|nr:hypothetical protein H355_010712 [Colinus virginianus]